jgi:hypothetical protein
MTLRGGDEMSDHTDCNCEQALDLKARVAARGGRQ